MTSRGRSKALGSPGLCVSCNHRLVSDRQVFPSICGFLLTVTQEVMMKLLRASTFTASYGRDWRVTRRPTLVHAQRFACDERWSDVSFELRSSHQPERQNVKEGSCVLSIRLLLYFRHVLAIRASTHARGQLGEFWGSAGDVIAICVDSHNRILDHLDLHPASPMSCRHMTHLHDCNRIQAQRQSTPHR